MNKTLENLVKDPLVYYVYQSGFSIYEIDSKDKEYIVIVDKKYKIPKDLKEEHCSFEFYQMDEWFKKVINNDILAWECSCLNKKFVIKEHVKLLLITNPLQIRKNFDAMMDPYFTYANENLQSGDFDIGKSALWEILKEALFANQIIDNHKIVNLKQAGLIWNSLNEADDNYESIMEKFLELSKKTISLLYKKTDDMLLKDKIKRALKNG